ncbi:hypothetical protein [Amycolatopsis echigonensis]|uniref:Uncharacterized protein n=1 Tax=Amycolatopsis echigonensis TaxID=2576905 RepID=A0A8E2B505_9PSEU|nr:hypothetical protein [Amycolatopsis echigonensis]MBB2502349.1 hypothetical protein [Amycolatopsis echigonensis]
MSTATTSASVAGRNRQVRFSGFPGMSPSEFIRRFFVDAQGIQPGELLTRIERTYVNGAPEQLALNGSTDT